MKKLIFTFFLLFSISLIQAQTTAYFKVANHGFFDKIEKVSSGGNITVGMDSNYKVQIIRWDNNFGIAWKYKFTDANISLISPKIVEANDGSFYFMSASTEHTGSTWIVKFSSTGALLWQKIYYLASGNLNSVTLSKAVAGDNGFLFGGGQCTLNNYIIKCDPNGNIEWQNQYYYPLTTGVITCCSIITDGSEYVVSSSYNINSLLTFKLSATGNINSHTAYTYTGMQIIPLRMVKLNSTGGYAIVGGYNNSNDNKTEFVAIYNQSLSLQSFNELTVAYTQFILNDITPVSNGKNVIVDGSIYDGSAFTGIMINLSNTGSVVWKKRAAGNTGGNTNVEFKGLTTLGNATLHVGAGSNEGCVMAIIDSNGNGLCNDVTFDISNPHKTLTLQSQTMSIASSTALMATVNYTNSNQASYNKQIYCGSLNAIENNELPVTNAMRVFPNPATDKCMITFDENKTGGNTTITIYELSGKAIYTSRVEANINQKEVDVSHFPQGMYVVKIWGDKGVGENGKILIMK